MSSASVESCPAADDRWMDGAGLLGHLAALPRGLRMSQSPLEQLRVLRTGCRTRTTTNYGVRRGQTTDNTYYSVLVLRIHRYLGMSNTTYGRPLHNTGAASGNRGGASFRRRGGSAFTLCRPPFLARRWPGMPRWAPASWCQLGQLLAGSSGVDLERTARRGVVCTSYVASS